MQRNETLDLVELYFLAQCSVYLRELYEGNMAATAVVTPTNVFTMT